MQRRVRVDDLAGAQLDAAVARAERRGLSFDVLGEPPVCFVDGAQYSPSSDWSQGGPIIERERILVAPKRAEWRALCGPWDVNGPTPLVAAMRAYVASKCGVTVELP
jgi:hypothetical protein